MALEALPTTGRAILVGVLENYTPIRCPLSLRRERIGSVKNRIKLLANR
jgi:hypothetical protein